MHTGRATFSYIFITGMQKSVITIPIASYRLLAYS